MPTPRLGLLAVLLAGGCDQPERQTVPRRAFPSFVSGDECLFCHREKIGPGWQDNRHNRTVRREDRAGDATHRLGAGSRALELRESGHGRFAMRGPGGGWDEAKFQSSCAGCHATAFDPEAGRFATAGLDCCVCHGDVPLEHSREPARALLSRGRRDPARTVVSACAQCHIRNGRSRRTGSPFPDRFVAGDELFEDFEVDTSDAALERVSRIDRHVLLNVREVLGGGESVTCLSCHRIHGRPERSHGRVAAGPTCFACHPDGTGKAEPYALDRGSPTCEP